jgi:hypothetical protein
MPPAVGAQQGPDKYHLPDIYPAPAAPLLLRPNAATSSARRWAMLWDARQQIELQRQWVGAGKQ